MLLFRTSFNHLHSFPVRKIKEGKGKAIPLQAWTGPEGSRKLSSPDFKTKGILRW
jgi:hypothetical protein